MRLTARVQRAEFDNVLRGYGILWFIPAVVCQAVTIIFCRSVRTGAARAADYSKYLSPGIAAQ